MNHHLNPTATSPGLEPGPSPDGMPPFGQGGPPFWCRHGMACLSWRWRYRQPRLSIQGRETCDDLPVCKGSVDLCPPGHALARNSRQAGVRASSPRLQGEVPVPERQHGAPVHSPP